MVWWEDGVGLSDDKYQIKRAVKKVKKAAEKDDSWLPSGKTEEEVYGDWNPYTNLRPYIQLKVFILLYIPFCAWVVYNHLEGNWPDSGGPFALVIFAAIVGVPIYHIGAALWLAGYNHPGAVDLQCPGCGHAGKPGMDSKGYAENFFTFLWNRVIPVKCPQCKLEFEVANMSQFWWPYNDEPHPGKKYGDSSKIRVRPKVPLRFGKFIFMKKKGFYSSHYELIKVGPVAALLIGVPWYFGFLDLIILVIIATGCFHLFVWRHEKFQGFREMAIEKLEDIGILRKNYTMKWWQELILNFIFMLIALGFVWLSLFEGVTLFSDFRI